MTDRADSTPTVAIAVEYPFHVVRAQREVKRLGEQLGFDEADAGRAQILVTELATNLIAHVTTGWIVMSAVVTPRGSQLELVAIDRGHGLLNERGELAIEQALRDGFSTAGSAGTGLGAVVRLSSQFAVTSERDKGTVIVSRMMPEEQPSPAAARLDVGAVSLPYPGYDVCGDGWAWAPRPGGLAAVVLDGLGHGEDAAKASRRGIEVFHDFAARGPGAVLEAMHAALRSTRGAVGAVVDIDTEAGTLCFAGAGNIAGWLRGSEGWQSLTWPFGTLGVRAPRIRTMSLPWSEGATLVLHSDGVNNRWTDRRNRILVHPHPTINAGLLLRDHRRARDDACAVVIRNTPGDMS